MWNLYHRRRGGASAASAGWSNALSFERLEGRLVMAGNVMAHVVGGNLIVIGDDAGATITVSQTQPGQFTLTGDDTTINGSAQPTTFTKVTGDLRFNFGAGDDTLQFDESSPISIHGQLSISGGSGSNTVTTFFGPSVQSGSTQPGLLTVGGNLTILNLTGPIQTVQLMNLDVKGGVNIVNLGGAVFATMSFDPGESGQAVPNSIRGNVTIVNGPGVVDQNSFTSLNVKGNVQIINQANVTFTGINSFDASNVIGGSLLITDSHAEVGQISVAATRIARGLQILETAASSSVVSFAGSVGGPTSIVTGDGADQVFVGESTFGGPFLLSTGKGNDAVYIGGPAVQYTVTQFRIVTFVDQNGNVVKRLVPVNEVFVAGGGPVTFGGNVTALFGDGDDTLTLATDAEVKFKKGALFDGQGGSNSANVDTNNLPAKPTFAHFQVNAV